MKKPYAICRTKKLHMREITSASHHNFRTRPVENANPFGAIIPILGAMDGNSFNKVIAKRFEQWKIRKLAAHSGKRGAKMSRDPVVCVEVMLSASPEYFRPNNPDKAGYWELNRLNQWERCIKDFARTHFGKNLVSLVLHLDEATPHAHALVMPFDEHGNLNAKKVFNRQGLVHLQDSYAKACEPLGLQRGLRGSTAKHEQVKRFYSLVNLPSPEPGISKLKPRIPKTPDCNERKSDSNLQEYAVKAFKAGAAAAVQNIEDVHAAIQAKANAYDLFIRKEETLSKSLDTMQKAAHEVRVIPLQEVLVKLGASEVDGCWCMPSRRIAIAGSKFYDEIARKSGNGAIDLVMHCEGVDYKEAVAWLSLEFGPHQTIGEAVRSVRELVTEPASKPAPLPSPVPAPEHLLTVIDYLIRTRNIPEELVNTLVENGVLFADRYANCVFTLKNEEGKTGYSLMGTGSIYFSTTRGDNTYFALPPANLENNEAIFVKSPLDALSYRSLHPGCGWIYAAPGNMIQVLVALGRQLKRRGISLVMAFDMSARGIAFKEAFAEVGNNSRVDLPLDGDWNDKLFSSMGSETSLKLKPITKPKTKTPFSNW